MGVFKGRLKRGLNFGCKKKTAFAKLRSHKTADIKTSTPYLLVQAEEEKWWNFYNIFSTQDSKYLSILDEEFYVKLYHAVCEDISAIASAINSLCSYIFTYLYDLLITTVIGVYSIVLVIIFIYLLVLFVRQSGSKESFNGGIERISEKTETKESDTKTHSSTVRYGRSDSRSHTYTGRSGRSRERTAFKAKNERRHSSPHSGIDKSDLIVSNPHRKYWGTLLGLLFLGVLLSIPWEFVRLYQSAVAEKVTHMTVGIPAECVPEQMSLGQSIKSWFRWQFSWSSDPCLVYHKALLVDPIWQVSPLMVISLAISHCVIYPFEVILGGLGRALRNFFSEIPTQWQPFMLVIIVVFALLTLVMLFGYRIHLPFLLKLEPRTPVAERVVPRTASRTRKEPNQRSIEAAKGDTTSRNQIGTRKILNALPNK